MIAALGLAGDAIAAIGLAADVIAALGLAADVIAAIGLAADAIGPVGDVASVAAESSPSSGEGAGPVGSASTAKSGDLAERLHLDPALPQ